MTRTPSLTAGRPRGDQDRAPATAVAGTDTTYTIKVKNLGPSDNAGFSLTDTLPAGHDATSARAGGCTETTGTVTCSATSLLAGATATFTITVHIAPAFAARRHAVQHRGDQRDQHDRPRGRATTARPRRRPSSVRPTSRSTKSAAPDPATAGTDETFTLKVTNLGPSDNAGFTLSDVLPAGTSFVSASAGCANVAGTVTCTSTGLALQRQRDLDDHRPHRVGLHQRRQPVQHRRDRDRRDDRPRPGQRLGDLDDHRQPVRGRGRPQGREHRPGHRRDGHATYTITVTNAGPSDAEQVTLSDSLPARFDASSATYCTGTGAPEHGLGRHPAASAHRRRWLGQRDHPGDRQGEHATGHGHQQHRDRGLAADPGSRTPPTTARPRRPRSPPRPTCRSPRATASPASSPVTASSARTPSRSPTAVRPTPRRSA